jgi:hypothetical protein
MMKRLLIILCFLSSVCEAQNVGTIMRSDIPSNRVVYMRSKGIASNADLSLGSSTFGTDQTAQIQAILDLAATYGSLYVFWDVAVSVDSFRIHSNTTIDARFGISGAILRDDADTHLARNYNWTPNNNAIVDSNITIIGGTWNGNGFRGGVAQQLHSGPTHGMTSVFNFYGVKNLTLTDFTILNSRTYAGFFTTTEKLYINNFRVYQGLTPQINQDGFDIVGLAKGVTITNGVMTCADDRLAFGSDAVGGGSVGDGGDLNVNTGVAGIQENIRIDNIVFEGEGKGLRFNSSVTAQQNVHVSNISGTARTSWLYLESENNIAQNPAFDVVAGEGNAKNMVFENINVSIDSVYDYDYLPDHHGQVQIGITCENIVFRNITRNNMSLAYPTFAIHPNYGDPVINGLIIDGYRSNESGTTYTGDHIQFLSGVTVIGFELLNSTVAASGDNGVIIVNILSGADVGNPKLVNVDGRNVNTILKHSGELAYIKAMGISHAGFGTASFVTTATVSDLNLTNYSGDSIAVGTFTTKRGDAFGSAGGTGGSSGGEETPDAFVAGFAGAGATALSSYTPEYGTIGTITGSPVLNGSGQLTMPSASSFLTTSFAQASFSARLDVTSIADGASLYFLALSAGADNAYMSAIRSGSNVTITPLINDNETVVGGIVVDVTEFKGFILVRDAGTSTLAFYYIDSGGTPVMIDSQTNPAHTYTNIKVNNITGATATIDKLRIHNL